MLGRLLKHEMKSTSRIFIPMILGFIAISLINLVSFKLGLNPSAENNLTRVISTIFIALYVICIISFYILTYVFITIHFYKNMIGTQGYLTHTLPVKTSTIINSKLICSVFWQSIVMLLISISVFTILKSYITPTVWNEYYSEIALNFKQMFGMSMSKFGVFIACLSFIGTISSSLMFYCSIACGTFFGHYKLVGSIASYIVIYLALQIITTMGLTFSGFLYVDYANYDPALFGSLYINMMILSVMISLLSTIVLYFVTDIIFSKKLNLE